MINSPKKKEIRLDSQTVLHNVLRLLKHGLLLHYSPFRKALKDQQEDKSCQWAEPLPWPLIFHLVGSSHLGGKMERGLDLYKFMSNGYIFAGI